MPARIVLAAFYLAALVSLIMDWPPLVENILQYGTLLLLLAHALEVVVAWRWLRMYEGGIALSVILTLLFGFLHWRPYQLRAAGADSAR